MALIRGKGSRERRGEGGGRKGQRVDAEVRRWGERHRGAASADREWGRGEEREALGWGAGRGGRL